MTNDLKHIAFIMDGNGRYAKSLHQQRTFGHVEGAKRIPEIILGCQEKSIPYISFFAFSTENWNRSKTEVNFLMKLLEKYLSNKSLKFFKEHQINLNIIGFQKNLDKSLSKKINEFEHKVNTVKYETQVNIFFNYGSQDEIIYAIKELVKSKKSINKTNFESCLLTNKLPDVDLLIRTSGEKRISNFLLWQIAYSEIIFEPKFWPEYTKEILFNNIVEYYGRARRFGAVKDEIIKK